MEALIKQRIEEAATFLFKQRGLDKESCRQAMYYILSNQWISVEEGLPEERDKEDEQYSTNVFTRTKDCIRYAYYDFYNESWCSVEGGYRFGGDVTHWMPIPSLEGGEK